MAAYDTNYISRGNAAGLIPAAETTAIFEAIAEQSIVMRLGSQMANMTSKQTRLPVMNLLPEAYFVNGDTGLKTTSSAAWDNKYFDAEELAVIIPVPQAVYDDASYDIWTQLRPRIVSAIGKAFDQAVLFGVNAPTSWPTDILAGATANSKVIADGTTVDLYDSILGVGGLFDLVDLSGYTVTGNIGAPGMKAKLRGLRTSTKEPVFNQIIQDTTRYELDGTPIDFPRNGGMDPAKALLISGDFTQLVWTVRQDITFRVFDQGVITDSSKAIVHNLMQQDMLAMRVTMRLAWQLPNPANNIGGTTRYPFAAFTPAPAG